MKNNEIRQSINDIDKILGEKTVLKDKKVIRLLHDISVKLDIKSGTDDKIVTALTDFINIKKQLELLNESFSKSFGDSNITQKFSEISDSINSSLTTIINNIDKYNSKEVVTAITAISEDIKNQKFPTDIRVVNQEKFPEEIIVANFPKEFTISNFSEIANILSEGIKIVNLPEEIKISNFPETQKVEVINLHKTVKVDKPTWYKAFDVDNLLEKLSNLFDNLSSKVFNVRAKVNENPKNAIAVKLFDSKDKQIDNFNPNIYAGGGSGPDSVNLKNTSNTIISPATETKQDDIITAIENIDISIDAEAINLNTDEIEGKLDTIANNQLADGHEVKVNNLPTEYPLPAAQVATLTPPAAIAGFATSVKQDTLNSLIETLQELTARLAALNGVVANTQQLRVVATGAVTATGGGYVTSAQVVAALLTQTLSLMRTPDNTLAIQSNINNVTA